MSSAYFFGLLKNAAFASLISLYFCVRALLMLIFSRRLICFFPLRAHSPKKINDASFHPISVLTTGLKKTRFLKTAHLYSTLTFRYVASLDCIQTRATSKPKNNIYIDGLFLKNAVLFR